MAFPDIRTLVPHAKPMLLLDRVVSAHAESLCAEVTIRPTSLFYRNDSGNAGVDAWIGIEYMAQAVAAYAGYMGLQRGKPVKVGFLLGTRHYQCNCSFFALGSILQISVRCILEADNGVGAFECTITDINSILATATINAFQPDNFNNFLERIMNE